MLSERFTEHNVLGCLRTITLSGSVVSCLQQENLAPAPVCLKVLRTEYFINIPNWEILVILNRQLQFQLSICFCLISSNFIWSENENVKIKQDGENASVVNVISDLKGTKEAGWEIEDTEQEQM